MVVNSEFGKSIPFNLENTSTNMTIMSEASTVLSDNCSVNSISMSQLQQQGKHEMNNHSVTVSNNMDFGSIEWSMPGMGLDQGMHQKSIQMMAQSMHMINNINEEKFNSVNNKIIGKSIQYEQVPKNIKPEVSTPIGSVEMKNIGKSVKYNVANIGKSMDKQNISSSVGGGDGFIHWQMHGRKLMKMSHQDLMRWLSTSGFDQETIEHFRKKKIDGKKLWQNIRNASMFLYNVGLTNFKRCNCTKYLFTIITKNTRI